MSKRDDRVSLVDMRNYAAEAVELTEGIFLEKLFEDRVRQLALLKLVETVGEAANRVSERAKQKHTTTSTSTSCGRSFETICLL